MPIVSNAGPILSFARAGKLGLLQSVVTELFLPDAVGEEIGDALLKRAPWLKLRTVRNHTLVATLPQKLHLGEREAIVLAEELNAVLLIDEREARGEARKRGLNTSVVSAFSSAQRSRTPRPNQAGP